MANGGAKVQGPGGLGQWDTGTANRDIRSVLNPSSRTGNSGGGGGGGFKIPSGPGYTTPLKPGDKGYTFVGGQSRKKARAKGRKFVRSSGRGSAKAR